VLLGQETIVEENMKADELGMEGFRVGDHEVQGECL
jgi:hypothetical protein